MNALRIYIVLIGMVVALAVPTAGQCQSNSCPSAGGGFGGGYGQPGYEKPAYGQPVSDQAPFDTPPADLPARDFTPTDKSNGFQQHDAAQSAFSEDESFAEPAPISEFKAIDCEVQVQHPLTFDWKTIKEFSNEADAISYQEQLEKRFWVIYQPRGAAADSRRVLEAKSKSDARSQASALRHDGNRITQVQPVEVQVVEKSLSNILAEEHGNSGRGLIAAQDEAAAGNDEAMEIALANFTQTEAPTIQSELAPLVGLWQATTEQSSGELQTVFLEVFDDGTATLTVPDDRGGTVSINRDVSLTEGNLLLSSGEKALNLGKVKSATEKLVVLTRKEGDLIFQRQ